MIDFLFSAASRVLLIRFATSMTAGALAELNDKLDRFVQREGAVDTIFDCSDATVGPTEVVVSQGLTPTRMLGRRRVFVAGSDVIYGLLRLYGSYQHGLGTPTPPVVRSLEEALEMFGLTSRTSSRGPGARKVRPTARVSYGH
jgi:hypothetical protein